MSYYLELFSSSGDDDKSIMNSSPIRVETFEPKVEQKANEINYFFEERFSLFLSRRCGYRTLGHSRSGELFVVEITVLICAQERKRLIFMCVVA